MTNSNIIDLNSKMKPSAKTYFYFTLICLVFSCSKNDDTIPLPDQVGIQVIGYDLEDSSVTVKGTEFDHGLNGQWSLESETSGSFIEENNSLTIFSGGLFENHILRWTISNGSKTIFAEETINFSDEFSLEEIIQIGIEINLLLENYTVEELVSVGIAINELIDANVPITDLINAGVDISTLIDNGIAVSEIIDANIPITDILNAGVSSTTLINLGITKNDLLSIGAIKQVPNTNIYVLNYVYEKFEHSVALSFCSNLVIEDLDEWYLPSIEELRQIYNHRDEVLLEITNEDYWSSSYSHTGTDENGINDNYFTKNMTDGFESTFYGFKKRIIPIISF